MPFACARDAQRYDAAYCRRTVSSNASAPGNPFGLCAGEPDRRFVDVSGPSPPVNERMAISEQIFGLIAFRRALKRQSRNRVQPGILGFEQVSRQIAAKIDRSPFG